MKNIYLIIIIPLFFSLTVWAQSKDSTAAKPSEEKKEQTTRNNTDPGAEKFVDENGDGINDNQQKQGKGRRKGNSDKFIDKDGDGINDNRCNGLGLGNQGKMKRYGKRGK